MKAFSDFAITRQTQGFVGEKIDINRVLNREIIIHDYRIEDSKFGKEKGNGKCLHLQIEMDGTKYVIFSGSGVLMDSISQVPKEGFPFKTTIVKEIKYFKFT